MTEGGEVGSSTQISSTGMSSSLCNGDLVKLRSSKLKLFQNRISFHSARTWVDCCRHYHFLQKTRKKLKKTEKTSFVFVVSVCKVVVESRLGSNSRFSRLDPSLLRLPSLIFLTGTMFKLFSDFFAEKNIFYISFAFSTYFLLHLCTRLSLFMIVHSCLFITILQLEFKTLFIFPSLFLLSLYEFWCHFSFCFWLCLRFLWNFFPGHFFFLLPFLFFVQPPTSFFPTSTFINHSFVRCCPRKLFLLFSFLVDIPCNAFSNNM